jgi:DnaJ-domain-containing protein 1
MAFRRKRPEPGDEGPTDDESASADRARANRRTGRDEDELDARLGAVSSRFTETPTPEELRAAFSRRPSTSEAVPPSGDFARRFPTETLFSPTVEEPSDPDSGAGEDRSRTKGDYYYDPDDAWAVLGVQPGASWEQIASAHRRLAMKHHPDRLLNETPERRTESEAIMRDVNVAYTVLRRLTGH